MKTIDNLSELSSEALTMFKKALAQSNAQQGDPRALVGISKAITQGTGLVWYDLQAPAKNLFPVLTPLRNRIPRTAGNGGTATNWIAVTGINTAALRGFVPEGRRNGSVTTTTTPNSATYKSLGLEDSVTFEAELAAKNFENIRATTGQRLLWATMIEEELQIIGANYSLALGTPTLATPTFVGAGGLLSNATYYCNVVALTAPGYAAASLTSLPDLVTVTSADGAGTYTYGGGNSIKSAEGSVATTLTSVGSYLTLSCTPVTGAVAYAWFVSTSTGHARLQTITTTNVAIVGKTAALSTTNLDVSTLAGTDQSKNLYGFDGLLSQALATSSGAYVKTLATDTTNFIGTALTGNGAGGVKEIDTLFKDRWDNYKLPVDELWMNSQESQSITNLILGASGATYGILHSNVDNTPAGMGSIVGGGRVKSLINNFAMNGRVDVPINIHPNIPAGTIIGLTWNLPYPVNEVPNVIEMKLRRDYYQMEWPLRTRKYESGVYMDGVLACYFPPAISIIQNVAPLH